MPVTVAATARWPSSSSGSRPAAPDSSATAPVATARSQPWRASNFAVTVTVIGAAPASTHARSASRARAAVAPGPLGHLRRQRRPGAAERHDRYLGAEAVGLGRLRDRLRDLVDRAVEQL